MRNAGTQETGGLASSWFPYSPRFGGRGIPLNDHRNQRFRFLSPNLFVCFVSFVVKTLVNPEVSPTEIRGFRTAD
jgi:hypothetical protein